MARGCGEDTLLIRAVHNLEKTRELLALFLRDNLTARELAKQLHHPPCLARGVVLRPYIHAFMKAEENGYFDFEINPGTPPNGGPATPLPSSGVTEGPPSES